MATRSRARITPTTVVHSRRAAILALLGVALSIIPMPWSSLSLLALGGGAYESVHSIRTAKGRQAGRTRNGSVVGLVLIVLLAVVVALPYAFYKDASAYQRCQQAANTNQAMARCSINLHHGLAALLGNR